MACPVLRAELQAVDGGFEPERFLIDTGADRTVLSASLLARLALSPVATPSGFTIEGIGGGSAFVVVRTVLKIPSDDGGAATLRGDFAAFTAPTATEISILGREVLDHFDVILGRQRGDVLLLAREHAYHVVTA